MARVLPVSEVKNRLEDLITLTNKSGVEVLVSLKPGGKPAAALVSTEKLEELKEIVAEESSEWFQNELKEAEEDHKAGRVKTLEELKRSLKLD